MSFARQKRWSSCRYAFGGVVRSSAAEVRLRDECADLAPELVEQGVQLGFVGGRVEDVASLAQIPALGHREGDELHTRVALGVGLRAGHRVRQPLLAVETVPRSQNHRPGAIPRHRRPEGFLNRLGAGRGPHHLFHPRSAGAGLQRRSEAVARLDFQGCDGVVGGERQCHNETVGNRAPIFDLVFVIPTHVCFEALHPTDRIVPEVRDEDTGGEVEEPFAFGRPMVDAGAAREYGLRRRERAQRARLE